MFCGQEKFINKFSKSSLNEENKFKTILEFQGYTRSHCGRSGDARISLSFFFGGGSLKK